MDTGTALTAIFFFIKELIAIVSEKGFKRLKEIEIRNQIEKSLAQHRIFLRRPWMAFY